MVTLPTHSNRITNSEKLITTNDMEVNGSKTPVTDVKLEPIKCIKLEDVPQKKTNGILNLPSENIKNRLSFSANSRGSGESFSLNDIKEQSSGSEASLDLRENLTGSSEVDNKTTSDFKVSSTDSSDIGSKSHFTHKRAMSDSKEYGKLEKSRSSSCTRLEKLTTQLDTVVQKTLENGTEEFNNKLGDLCSDVLTNVRLCDERLEVQKESLRISKEDTSAILNAFKNTTKLESRLKNSLLTFEEGEMSFVNEILSEELKFQAQSRDGKVTDKNGNVTKREPRVNSEEKKKLLATLKAIDNGDSIDSLESSPAARRQSNFTTDMFSDLLK